jgi:hypothetical protein
MRVLVQPGLAARAKPPVRVFLLFAALALAAYALGRVHQGGLSPAGVEAFYLGPDASEPLAAVALWEEVHVGAFVYGFVLFMLGSLLAVSPAPALFRRDLFGLAVAAALADLFAPFAVVAAGGGGALRVATFALATLATAALLVAALVLFGWAGRLALA